MAGTFVPRLNSSGMQGSVWWYTAGSYPSGNPFYPTYGLPNCTCYAYGRYAEARGAWANLPTWDAKDWYDDATSFQRGSTPALGAVMCWGETGGYYATGHVAIVEQVFPNGDVVISESHSSQFIPEEDRYFCTQTLTQSSGYSHPYLGYGFYLQGFIYNDWSPGGGGGGQPLPPSSWQATTTGGFNRTSNEAFQNAICTYRKLSALGWSLNAICAVYGNFEAESGYNPWRWESDDVPYYPSTPSYGYGLPQFTPSSKYISDSRAQGYVGYAPNWSDHAGNPNDGDAQLEFIHNFADYFPTPEYQLSYEDFKHSGSPAGYLAIAWLYNYERPADPSATENYRAQAAEYWYSILSQYSPSGGAKKMKIWMMCGVPPLY